MPSIFFANQILPAAVTQDTAIKTLPNTVNGIPRLKRYHDTGHVADNARHSNICHRPKCLMAESAATIPVVEPSIPIVTTKAKAIVAAPSGGECNHNRST